MSNNHFTPDEAWAQVVSRLYAGSEGDSLTDRQRTYLQQVAPAALLPGIAVLSVQEGEAKAVIEGELGPLLQKYYAEVTGSACSLAVTVIPQVDEPAAQSAAPAAPVAESHIEQVAREIPLPHSTHTADLDAFPAPSPSISVPTSNPPAAPAPAKPVVDDHDLSVLEYLKRHGKPPSLNRGDIIEPTPATPAEDAQRFEPSPERHRDLTETPAPRPESADSGWQESTIPSPDQAHSPSTHKGVIYPAPTSGMFPREEPAPRLQESVEIAQRYTFDNFVQGESNRFAVASSVSVAENPSSIFNPLFIYGSSGLGKTHLLRATAAYAKQLNPALNILYVSSEEFTNDFINSVRDDRLQAFKARYRTLDFLIIDDIQFLAGKEQTQEEFFHTFNELYQANKQIMLSSDRPPQQLSTLHDRLTTRFQQGLLVDIQPPDLETRIAILMKKAAFDNVTVDREVLEFIASSFKNSIRELEGALIRVSAVASLDKEPLTIESAKKTLANILPDDADIQITIPTILEVISEYFGQDIEAIIGTRRSSPVAHARQLAMYLCRELTDSSLLVIGREFGGKDHTTVLYAERKISEKLQQDRETFDQIQELTQLIKQRSRG